MSMLFIFIQCAFTCGACGASVNSVKIQTKVNSRKGTDKSLSLKERLSNKSSSKFVSSKCQNPWSGSNFYESQSNRFPCTKKL